MTARPLAPVTAEQAETIREAHYAPAARGRGKSGVHTTTDAFRSLLDVLAELTGIDSEALPFGDQQ